MAAGLFAEWQRRGSYLEVRGRRLFAVDLGPRDAPALLVLHGFPSSSSDFHRVVDRLAEEHRVVLHDHLGFGLSDKPARYSYSLLEQAEVAVEVWRQLGIESGHLIGHDYGTSVATEILARRERDLLPIGIDSVTLSNGSILIGLAKLRLSQQIARSRWLGPAFGRLVFAGYFKRVMRRLWGDRSRVVEADLDAMWAGIVHEQGNLRVHAISSYIDERYRFHERWVGALDRLDLPTLVLWARRDPVAVAAIGSDLADRIPGARLVWLEELGHYPMLEDPEAWSAPLIEFLHSRRPAGGKGRT